MTAGISLTKGWGSHLSRNFLLIFLPAALAVFTLLGLFHFITIQNERVVLEAHELSRVHDAQKAIQKTLQQISSDLLPLANAPTLQQFLETPSADLQEKLGQEYLNLAAHKKIYDQVRYLDATGMEIVRVNYNNGAPAVVEKQLLQNKAKRYYFADAFSLEPEKIFVSPLDLNIEGGELERPHKPMIRFGTPVSDTKGQKRGLVLLNYFGKELLDSIRETMSAEAHQHVAVEHASGRHMESEEVFGAPLLLNQQGYWLLGLREEDEWGFMLNNDHSFSKEYPLAWQKISQTDYGQFETPNGMFTFVTIYPLRAGQISTTGSPLAFCPSFKKLEASEYTWKLVSFIDQQQISKLPLRSRQMTAYFFLAFLFLLVPGCWYFARIRFSREQAEKAIKQTRDSLQSVVDNVDAMIYIADVSTYEILLANAYTQQQFGKVQGKRCWEVLQKGQAGPCKYCKVVNQEKRDLKLLETNVWEVQNSINGRWYECRDRLAHWLDNRLVRVQIATDITERRETQEKLQDYAATQKTLLREVNHRVKNNLAAIIGMLSMEEDRLDEKDATHANILHNLVSRIHGLSTVHSLLSAGEWRPISLDHLCREIISAALSAVPPSKKIDYTVSATEIKIGSDQAHHLALVLNELTTNTVKYALPGRMQVQIEVGIVDRGQGLTEITFRDNGPGYPTEIVSGDMAKANVGMEIIQGIISSNLQGRVTFENDNGALTTLFFVVKSSHNGEGGDA